MPTKDKRLSVPLSDESFEHLEYITKALGVTKASVIKEILDDTLPQIRSMAEYADSVGDKPRMNELSSKIAAQLLGKLSDVFTELSEMQGAKKDGSLD